MPAGDLVSWLYYVLVRNADADQRAKIDASLSKAAAIGSVSADPGPIDRRDAPPPTWWKGEQAAADQGMAMLGAIEGFEQQARG